MLSGYRVFSRRFVKSFPVLSRGFEIETELTVHALELELPVAEIATPYYARPPGSASKLSTWRDGLRILAHHPAALPLRAAAGVLSGHRHRARRRLDRARDPDLRHLRAAGHRAAPADRGPVDRADAARLPVDRRRARARHGDARPARDEAARLSGATRAGRRCATGGRREGERHCANSSAPTTPCWSPPSRRCSTAPTSRTWCSTRT